MNWTPKPIDTPQLFDKTPNPRRETARRIRIEENFVTLALLCGLGALLATLRHC